MERTKRKNVFRAELIIFLAVIAVSLLVLWIRWENSHATYKNYDIVVKKNVYCEKTQTGRVDLQIRRKGGKKAKLLQTQQELKRSQSFQIVEDSYKLGIVDDASVYDGNIYINISIIDRCIIDNPQFIRIFYNLKRLTPLKLLLCLQQLGLLPAFPPDLQIHSPCLRLLTIYILLHNNIIILISSMGILPANPQN